MKIWQYIPSSSIYQEKLQRINEIKVRKPNNVELVVLTKSPIASQNRNVIACKILQDNPTDVWIDADVTILKWWIPPNDGFIYTNFSTTVIFPNGNKDVFATLYEDFLKTDRECRWMLPQLLTLKAKWKDLPMGNFRQPIREPEEVCPLQEGNDLCKLNILKKDRSYMKFWSTYSKVK